MKNIDIYEIIYYTHPVRVKKVDTLPGIRVERGGYIGSNKPGRDH